LCSETAIVYKGNRILAHCRHILDDYWSIFTAHAQKRLIRSLF